MFTQLYNVILTAITLNMYDNICKTAMT